VDFEDTPAEAAFRADARAWLDDHIGAAPPAADGVDLAAARRWQRELADGGWGVPSWPVEFGGRAASPVELFVWSQELARHHLPMSPFTIGLSMMGPTLIAHGTAEQQARYLGPMVAGDELWCQLWSEPGAGSDLAGLQTRAEHDEGAGEWRLTGQKVWTSYAHLADYALCLARSDPASRGSTGVTCFIVDMHAPGVDVRPLRQMTGDAEFNEVFLDGVAIPDDRVVGAVGEGWSVGRTTLMHERMSSGAGSFDIVPAVDALLAMARGRCGVLSPTTRQAVARLYTTERLVSLTASRSMSSLARGEIPGPEGSILKLLFGRHAAEARDAIVAVLGADVQLVGAGAPDAGRWSRFVLFERGIHIGGGTDEIQRTIIGERVLGLPREPAANR
jgi:alkylation response protein AidB-like acyl-CoA dehydrogenase